MLLCLLCQPILNLTEKANASNFSSLFFLPHALHISHSFEQLTDGRESRTIFRANGSVIAFCHIVLKLFSDRNKSCDI